MHDRVDDGLADGGAWDERDILAVVGVRGEAEGLGHVVEHGVDRSRDDLHERSEHVDGVETLLRGLHPLAAGDADDGSPRSRVVEPSARKPRARSPPMPRDNHPRRRVAADELGQAEHAVAAGQRTPVADPDPARR